MCDALWPDPNMRYVLGFNGYELCTPARSTSVDDKSATPPESASNSVFGSLVQQVKAVLLGAGSQLINAGKYIVNLVTPGA
jgi:hypothetical protein